MEKKKKFTFDPDSKALLDKDASSLSEDQLDLFKSIMEADSNAVSQQPFPEGTFYKIPVPPPPKAL